MEAPAELLAALPALATVLALLLAWLLVRRAPAPSSDPAGASLEPAPRAEASGTSALTSRGAQEPAAVPEEPGEPAGPAEADEQATEAKQEEEGQEQEQVGEQDPPPAEPEEEEGGEAFSFKYSPGKLRGNQYKKMMTKEELEEEQRIELTSDLTSL
ncbi:matrix-remodeling-associated protein 7 isoform X2 [Desmodus rotundus]|uniref:matrix-remodeling-associated protein 7 isoform X2 n=1 Tax=Desmodus rotundus TaxID=9430 RepID=UPI002380DE5C|nr:matrix-remodeling-associated protein 7 isoform X2 [Desmodus rotundus]XP_045046085.2 matrix-remodeling-associated protein 7 isoform X2 [Desmodus rotundus]XP_053767281.1 matrix-remodeling-associated protein 7 isoform X2 [Desmodus rotundus]